MTEDEQPSDEVQRRARIVQISDLHLGSWGKRSVVEQLKNIVGGLKADLLIVSGDQVNHPFPWAMGRASRLVEELRRRGEEPPIPALVLAGNHDYKFWGNVGLRRLTRVPFHLYFREKELDLSSRKARWGRALKLSGQALWPWSEALRDRLEIHQDPQRGLLLVGFNSNTLAEMMAAGKVEDSNLQEFSKKLKEWQQKAGFDTWYKIAVVHHHPAPIPFVKTDFKARTQESFMVLYNAGTLLRALYDAGFQLVLHGHKHFAGFTRIRYSHQPDDIRELAVAAAGSAGHAHPDDPRGNHLYVIDVFDDDTVALDSWFFTSDVERKDESRSFYVHDLEGVRRLRRQILTERHLLSASVSVKKVQITRSGYSEVVNIYRGCKVPQGRTKRDHPFSIQLQEPAYLRRVQRIDDPKAPEFASWEGTQQDLRSYRASLNFGRTYQPDDPPFDFGLSYRLMNGHTLNWQQFLNHYSRGSEEWEYSTIQCDVACNRLRCEVVFPGDHDMSRLISGIRVLYSSGPVLELDALDLENVRPHAREARRIEHLLRRDGHRLILEVDAPIPGFLYQIRWKPVAVEAPAGSVPLAAAAKLETGMKALLRLGQGVSKDDPQCLKLYRKVVERLQRLVDFFKAERLISLGRKEALDFSLMVFDEDARRLRFVALNFADLGSLFAAALVSGEGCAGYAFDRPDTVFYHPKKDDADYFIEPHEMPEGQQGWIRQECMISIPWVFPLGKEIFATLGVLNLGSRVPDSGLLSRMDLTQQEREARALSLTALTTTTGSDIFEIVDDGRLSLAAGSGS